MSVSNEIIIERLDHVIARLEKVENKVDCLMSAYQQAKGAKWMFGLLKGSGLIAVGTGLVKGIEWLSHSGNVPPYHP